MRNTSVKLLSVVGLAASLILSGCGGGNAETLSNDEIIAAAVATIQAQGQTVPINNPSSSALQGGASLEATLTQLYANTNPSVVYIVVPGMGSGSGFVYSEDGTIVTNNHVVAAGDEYLIVFSNGDQMYAELIGTDVDSDLAVLKVDQLPDGVKALPLAAEGSVKVGQLVAAIGNPFGEQGSMSLGIVSGLDRSLSSQRAASANTAYSLPDVIQTDAPINPGNSGGPLLNMNGEVVGINSAIESTTGTNSGVGFAIPVDAVRRIVPVLITEGEYEYPYIGASFDSVVSLDEMDVYGVSQTQGAYVVSVSAGTPAAAAGLIAADAQTGSGGDLIVQIDDQPIKSFEDLNSYLVFHASVGQTIQVTVLRNSERVTLPLTLGARP